MQLLIMELRFDTMLYTNLGSKNFVVGHIKCSCGPQVYHPTPYLSTLRSIIFTCELTISKPPLDMERTKKIISVFVKFYNAVLFFKLCTSRHKIGVRVRDATCRSLSTYAQAHPQNFGSFFPVSTLLSPISLCFIAAIEVFSLKFVKWLNRPWLQQQCFCTYINHNSANENEPILQFHDPRRKESDQDTTVTMKTPTVPRKCS